MALLFAIIVTKKGTILIFCAAHKDGFGDWSEIDISMRCRMDGGKTWSDPQIIADAGKATVDNIVPIVDLQTGAIHFLHQVNLARAYYIRSDDDGLTFSEPVEITETFLKFRQEYELESHSLRSRTPDNSLLYAKNSYTTPHIAWATQAARQHLMDVTVQNTRAFINGKPVNVVSR